jgi:hypothetical protein
MMDGAEESSRSLAIWHAAQYDRPKRETLKGVVLVEQARKHPQADKMCDIIWILKEAVKLEDARNNAIQLPLFLLGNSSLAAYEGKVGVVIPDILHENPRALRLLQKDTR